MGYYSFKVRSRTEVDLPEHMVTIGEGVDVFSARIDDVEAFQESLSLEGVQVLERHRLDDHEAIEPVHEVKVLLGNTTLRTLARERDE